VLDQKIAAFLTDLGCLDRYTGSTQVDVTELVTMTKRFTAPA